MLNQKLFNELVFMSLARSFTWREKNRIFRRKPKWWRDKWKRIYPKWLISQGRKNLREVFRHPPKPWWPKRDNAWEGKTFTFPINLEKK